MTIHKEGYATIGITGLALGLLNALSVWFLSEQYPVVSLLFFVVSLGFWLFIVSFFRIPARRPTVDANCIICPADGKVVVMEETTDVEYFKDRRLQVSIFMSPLNVHVNRNAVSGEVVYSQYHPGKFLVAWDPKSSTDNERHSVVYRVQGREILVKQIAGALARRIVNYLQPGMQVKQGEEMGFIKFGSRVDVLLPVGTKVHVQLNQVVQGGVTVLASW
ncbi:MAG: phosphatidylserine decarboxylase family protein [Chitinophagaceae bacterium]|nr:phosphatidylserine decarboxylase family protein [Chitinophagaceae bacterium]